MPSVLLLHVNSDDRQMYAEFLAGEGFEVTQVASTDAAVPLIPEADVVITGLQIPGTIDPVGLIAGIRRDPRTATIPVIVVTACGFSEWLRRARDAGADTVLLKPCLPSDLLAELRKAIAARAGNVRAVVKPDRRQLADRRAEWRGGRRGSDVSKPQMARIPTRAATTASRRRRSH